MLILSQSLMVTCLVFLMMMVVEYFNVLTTGSLRNLTSIGPGQYLIAILLGASPGCLGAFAMVNLYTHGLATPGALVAAMIATSGDEAYIMLALSPQLALTLMMVLVVVGLVAGVITDYLLTRSGHSWSKACPSLTVHELPQCNCLPGIEILRQWRHCSVIRLALFVSLALILFMVLGQPETSSKWIRTTLLLGWLTALFIILTAPDHFLREHLWRHVIKKHIPRVFFWTLGTLAVVHFLSAHLNLENLYRENIWAVLIIACLIGLIPESGPHLIFLTLFLQGFIPFSVLLANSIVQDGHGMLPLLASSRNDFLRVKLINLVVGLTVGIFALSIELFFLS